MKISDYKLENDIFDIKEFEFINTFNSDLNIIKNKIDELKIKRSILVDLVKVLNTFVSSSSLEEKETISPLVNDVSITFNLINENTDFYTQLEKTIHKLNSNLINLLNEIDSEKNISSYYSNKVNEIKKELNDYSLEMNNIKSDIVLNDIQINKFFKNPTNLEYFKKFEIDFSKLDTTKTTNSVLKNTASLISSHVKSIGNKILLISEKKRKSILTLFSI